jgi:hypothetical protein
MICRSKCLEVPSSLWGVFRRFLGALWGQTAPGRRSQVTPGTTTQQLRHSANKETPHASHGKEGSGVRVPRVGFVPNPATRRSCRHTAWNMAPGSPITLADVQAAEPVVQGKLDDEFFHVRFEKATPAERRYMAAMADLGDGPCRTGDIAKRLGSGVSSTSVHRDALIKKGLIFSPDHGEVDFTVPHFSPFMRRCYPVAAVQSGRA